MAESVLCLRWKDHTSEIASIYTSLLENNFLVDCTISAGGHSLKAHKLVLCACSPYFHRLFQEETGKHTFVILLDASFEILTAVIEFMYRGETQISNVDLKAFLTLAQSLQIKGLNDNSKDNANRNVSSATFRNVPEGPSEGNQATSEIPGVRTNQEVSAENISQTLPPHSDDYQNPARTNSSLPFEGLSSSQEEAWSSQEYQQPVGGNGVPTTMDVIVKRESLYAVISDTRNETWDRSNSDQQVSRNFASEVPQGSSSVFGERNLNQYSNSLDSRVGNVESSQVLPPQQQRMQIGNEESSDPKFDQEECLPHAVFVPVNEESEEPMDVRDVPEDDTNECVEVTEPACDRSSFLQPSSEDVILLEDDGQDQPRQQPYGTQVRSRNTQEGFYSPPQSGSRLLQELLSHKRPRSTEDPVLLVEIPQGSRNSSSHKRQHSNDEPVLIVENPQTSLRSTSHKRKHSDEELMVIVENPQASLGSTGHKPQHSNEEQVLPSEIRQAFLCSTSRTYQNSNEEPIRLDENSQASLSFSGSKRQLSNEDSILPVENPQTFLNFTSHNQLVSEERRFVCDVCNMAFAYRSQLNIHKHGHTGERPYPCDICGKAFVQKQDRTSHRRTHTGERPYRCDECGESFARSDTLLNHKRRHTGERPYGCDECGKKFSRLPLLTAHKRKHAENAASQ